MLKKILSLLIGKRLSNEELAGEKLGVFWGLPIMASDAISSVAYAVEEILWVLVLAAGLAAYNQMFRVSAFIVLLLMILVFSYRQTIDSYPHGGGSYTVARENLGEMPGLFAASSLIIGYVLTVAVSTSAGTAAITSAIPSLLPYRVWITLLLIVLMTLGNLRGVKESARIFAVPTYIFIAAMIILIVTGLFKVYILGYEPQPQYALPQITGDVTLFLFVRAFAAGCAGLTGVEAVSNAVPNFSEPSRQNAKRVLSLLALFVVLIFGGTSLLATLYRAVPGFDTTVLSQIAAQVFGNNIFYYILQISTAIILVMAANTSYAGLPTLLALVAKDGYAPRQFNMRGGRLGFSNGIVALSAVACVLVIIAGAETHILVPLYAIGVFISFTLSQLGMLVKWHKSKEAKKHTKMLINGLGAVMTVVTVVSIAYSKLAEGAWISLVLILLTVLGMKAISRHYKDIARQLRLEPEEVLEETKRIEVRKYTVVLVSSLNKATLKALNYARQLSNDVNIVAFHVSVDREYTDMLQARWQECEIPFPLIVKYSPYREIIEPLVNYIASEEHASAQGDIVTVVVPQFIVGRAWQNMLHNQTAFAIRKRLLHDSHIAVVTVPFVLER